MSRLFNDLVQRICLGMGIRSMVSYNCSVDAGLTIPKEKVKRINNYSSCKKITEMKVFGAKSV